MLWFIAAFQARPADFRLYLYFLHILHSLGSITPLVIIIGTHRVNNHDAFVVHARYPFHHWVDMPVFKASFIIFLVEMFVHCRPLFLSTLGANWEEYDTSLKTF